MTTDCEIRSATDVDVARITAIARAAYEPYIVRMGVEPAPMVADFAAAVAAKTTSVAVIEGVVVGFCVRYVRDDHVHLENVAVDPRHCAKGYGKALIDDAENLARSLGLTAVELYTNIHMTENQGLYPALGYREIRRSDESGFHRIYYRKSIAA